MGTDYNGTLTADYARPVFNDKQWFVSLDVNFTDGYQMGGSADPIEYQEGFSKTNFRTDLEATTGL